MAVVQEVIPFRSETWALTPQLDKYLEGVYHWAVRRMVGMGTKSQQDGTWVYTTIGEALEMVGLEEFDMEFLKKGEEQ